MKKRHLSVLTIFLALFFLPSLGFSWGSATHAYIDDHLGKKNEVKNMDEMYGGNGPDLFNFSFDNPNLNYLYYQTHNEFMKVWDAAEESKSARAAAFGFVSHNDVWGADSTAHHAGITFGQNEGYIIAKAQILKTILQQVPEYNALNLPDTVAMEICHNLVEYGADILIKRTDHCIGQKIITSAILRSQSYAPLLVKAYAQEYSKYAGISYSEAAGIITAAEGEFRKRMVLYGQALSQDEPTAIQLIAEQMAELAKSFLAVYGIALPDGVDLVPLITFGIGKSIEICAGDLLEEIDATIAFTDRNLDANRIKY